MNINIISGLKSLSKVHNCEREFNERYEVLDEVLGSSHITEIRKCKHRSTLDQRVVKSINIS